MKNFLQSIHSVFQKNTKNLLLFEIIFRFFEIILYRRICSICMSFAMRLAGYSYITPQNILRFIEKPATIPMLLLLLLLGILLICYEAAVLMTGFQASKDGYRLSLCELAVFGFQRLISKIRSRTFPLLLLSAPVFASMSLYLIYRFLSEIRLFSSIIDAAVHNVYSLTALIIIALFLAVITLPCVHLLFCVYFEDTTLRGHGKESRSKKIKLFALSVLFTAAVNIVGLVLYKLFYRLFVLLAAIIISAVSESSYVSVYILKVGRYIELFMLFAGSIFTMFISLGLMSGAFFNRRVQGSAATHNNKKLPSATVRVLTTAFSLLLILCLLMCLMQNRRSGIDALLQEIQISAHRGDSLSAPENTIPAISVANESLADMVEIDVQLTKDGEVVLCHDSNLKRTAGVKVKVSETSCAEIQTYDVGAVFSEQYTGTFIPTLSEVFDEFAGTVRFNIELKNYIGNANLPERVIELVREYDMENDCVITSTSHKFLMQIKELEPKIPTGYIVSSLYGNFYTDKSIDFFSVKSLCLNSSIVDNIHANGKGVYAWTVNSRIETLRLVNLGVDNIITDRPLYTREVLFSGDRNHSVKELVSLVMK